MDTALAGITLLWSIALRPDVWQSPHVAVALYVARVALTSCTYPLSKATLMDYVPKDARGRFERWRHMRALHLLDCDKIVAALCVWREPVYCYLLCMDPVCCLPHITMPESKHGSINKLLNPTITWAEMTGGMRWRL
jgi:hypothetical protein